MVNESITELETTATEFLDALDQISPGEINSIPFEGSWSAAQVGEHILKSVVGIPGMLRGKNKPADRDPEEKVATLRGIFLDLNKKMKSPEFIVPSATPPSKEELLSRLRRAFDNIIGASKEIKLQNLYTDFPFPQLGELTGYEWLRFAAYHTQRHNRQIHNIHRVLLQKQV